MSVDSGIAGAWGDDSTVGPEPLDGSGAGSDIFDERAVFASDFRFINRQMGDCHTNFVKIGVSERCRGDGFMSPKNDSIKEGQLD
jgi:hypothetical protein